MLEMNRSVLAGVGGRSQVGFTGGGDNRGQHGDKNRKSENKNCCYYRSDIITQTSLKYQHAQYEILLFMSGFLRSLTEIVRVLFAWFMTA